MSKLIKVFEVLTNLAAVILHKDDAEFCFSGNFWYGVGGTQYKSWKISDDIETMSLDIIEPIAQEMLRDFSKDSPTNWDEYDADDIALFESQMKYTISELKKVFGNDFNFKE